MAGCAAAGGGSTRESLTSSLAPGQAHQNARGVESSVPSAPLHASKDASPAMCAVCSKGLKSPAVRGATLNSSTGVQMLTVSTRTGFYEPNQFVVQADKPVTVVFEGVAKGCLAHPTFKQLGKSGDVTQGSATVQLGPLKAGTYKFTCAMGAESGTIVAR